MPSTARSRIARLTLLAVLACVSVGNAVGATAAGQKKNAAASAYDRAHDATARAAKKTDKALETAAQRTDEFVKRKKIPQKIDKAAAKAEHVLGVATDAVGLTQSVKRQPQTAGAAPVAPKKNQAKPAPTGF